MSMYRPKARATFMYARVVRDPELKNLGEGKFFTALTIAAPSRRSNKDEPESTLFLTVLLNGQQAVDVCRPDKPEAGIGKGDLVCAEGELIWPTEEFTDRAGAHRKEQKFKLTNATIALISKAKPAASPENAGYGQQPYQAQQAPTPAPAATAGYPTAGGYPPQPTPGYPGYPPQQPAGYPPVPGYGEQPPAGYYQQQPTQAAQGMPGQAPTQPPVQQQSSGDDATMGGSLMDALPF